MARRRRVKVNVGLQRISKSRGAHYPSEPSFVKQMSAQSRSLTDALLDILNQFEDASEDIMLQALEPTFEKALAYTPVDTEELRDSGYLEKASFRGKPRVEMGFAKGGKPDYAIYVHELEDYKHEAPTRAKFLETALKEDLNDIFVRLGSLYKQFMSGGSSNG